MLPFSVTIAQRNFSHGSTECLKPMKNISSEATLATCSFTCWIIKWYLLWVIQKQFLFLTPLTHAHSSPRANGEPLFSSHMLDLSEEFDEENIATCVKYFKVLWSCPNCPSIGDPDIVQFYTRQRHYRKISFAETLHLLLFRRRKEREWSRWERRKWERVNAL